MIGPVFNREVTIAPRRTRFYMGRAAYAATLLMLMFTAWLVLTGTQVVRDVGDLARFGMILFQILAPLQLALASLLAATLAASAVAQEKDRRTLELLLLTNLSNGELVLGKLAASLLSVLVMLAAALPVFMLAALLGGVSFGQIARVFAVTLASVVACGSLGSTVALWREKTFQSLATTVLALVLWLAAGEALAAGALGESWHGLPCATWAACFSPWQAILEAARPFAPSHSTLGPVASSVYVFLAVATAVAALLNGVAILRVRAWNCTPDAGQTRPDETAAADAPAGEVVPVGEQSTKAAAHTRQVWDNPVLWREIRTWAYGRKMLLIRLAYLVLVALVAASLHWLVGNQQLNAYAGGAVVLVPLCLLSLILVNAQAVTALTSERDNRALDLLLVTDLSPKELVFGKLGGVFYNTKEMVVLPLLLCGYLCYGGTLGVENLLYLLVVLGVLYAFVATLGIHSGMIYANSRSAIGTSLGTVLFLFLGVATCMRMLVAFSGSFHVQLLPFSALFLVGGVGLYVALGARNPSSAIALASFLCPFATFYAITSLWLGLRVGPFLVTVAAYGFATAAMLVPAIGEFDVATGRAAADET